jgi:hypothetical protein
MPKVCCERFDYLLEDGGSRGLGAVAYFFSHESRGFILEARGLDAKHCHPNDTEQRPREIHHTPHAEGILIAARGQDDFSSITWCVCTDRPLMFCPFCGASMESFIAKSFEAFFTLAESQREVFRRTTRFGQQRWMDGFR